MSNVMSDEPDPRRCEYCGQERTIHPSHNFYECLPCHQVRLALANWKAEAIATMPPFQEIGKALGVGLGQSVHDKILPGIAALARERDELRAKLCEAHWYYNDGETFEDAEQYANDEEMSPGQVFSADGARDTGQEWFRVLSPPDDDPDDTWVKVENITQQEYESARVARLAALAAAGSPVGSPPRQKG
jgi:hypothetical protein